MQKYTSANTSINSKKLPKIYSKAKFSGTVLDIGCGRYTIHIRRHLEDQDVEYLPYDPFNQPAEVNEKSLHRTRILIRNGRPVNVVCSNVLNVIDDEATVKNIARRIEYIVTLSHGRGYVTVYEGDKSGIGRQTGTDQYQRNEPISSYKKYFRRARISGGILIVGGDA